MPDVNESLPTLFNRRMGELGASSIRDLYQRLPKGDGVSRITYETVRKLVTGQQRGTRDDRVPRDVALMLDLTENSVRIAMGVGPTHGPWQVPTRANGLDAQERKVVLGVIDALLRAKRTGGSDAGTTDQKIDKPALTRSDVNLAARDVGGQTPQQKRRQRITEAGTNPDEEGPEHGA